MVILRTRAVPVPFQGSADRYGNREGFIVEWSRKFQYTLRVSGSCPSEPLLVHAAKGPLAW
jgi:hypothetical protein